MNMFTKPPHSHRTILTYLSNIFHMGLVNSHNMNPHIIIVTIYVLAEETHIIIVQQMISLNMLPKLTPKPQLIITYTTDKARI